MEQIRMMSLEELGLLAAMRWSCWANQDVPRDAKSLAKLLGKDVVEVERALTAAVMSFFEPTARTPSRLHCPELTNQRARMSERHAERSKSGRRGATARWQTKKSDGPANGSANGSLNRNELIGKGGFPSHEKDNDIPF
jgi:hypothetical protein